MDGHGTKRRRKIAENFNRLSRVQERYRQTTTDRRQTTDDSIIANVNVSSRLLIMVFLGLKNSLRQFGGSSLPSGHSAVPLQ